MVVGSYRTLFGATLVATGTYRRRKEKNTHAFLEKTNAVLENTNAVWKNTHAVWKNTHAVFSSQGLGLSKVAGAPL